jgi:Protein of unknown function (DUF4242)
MLAVVGTRVHRASLMRPLLFTKEAARGQYTKEKFMPLFLIERNFAEQLNVNRDAATAVIQVNADVGIQWLFSFLSADKRKTYCLYEAPSAEAIREAARKLNLPADVIVELGESRITPGAPELLTPTRGA